MSATSVVACVVAVLAGAHPLPAQDAAPPPLTVTGAMALARTHHPALAAASARRQVAVGAARQASALPNPVVEWRDENVGAPVERDRFLTVYQPLDVGGRRFALRDATRFVADAAIADSLTAAREVQSGAAQAYFRASLARALLAVAASLRTDAERLAEIEGHRAREGAVAGLVAMRAEVEADRAKLVEATALGAWERARVDLALAIGLRPEQVPAVRELIPAPRATTPMPDLAATQATAMERRTELLALRADVESTRRRRTAEARAVIPAVALQLGTMESAGHSARTIGVAIPIPLFDRNGGGRQRASGEVELAQAELLAAEQRVRAEVAAAIETLAALHAARLPAADTLAARAAEVARLTDAAYAEGGASLLELLDARRAYAESLTAALQWSAEVRLARLELNRASGALLTESLETP